MVLGHHVAALTFEVKSYVRGHDYLTQPRQGVAVQDIARGGRRRLLVRCFDAGFFL